MSALAQTLPAIMRGDSVALTITLAANAAGFPSMIFTVKRSAGMPDTRATIQKFTGGGLTATGTTATVTLVPVDTRDLAGSIFEWDIQGQAESGAVTTLAKGTLSLTGDITREVNTSIPVYTTEPTAPANAAASAAAALASQNAAAASAAAALASEQAAAASEAAALASEQAADGSASAAAGSAAAALASEQAADASAVAAGNSELAAAASAAAALASEQAAAADAAEINAALAASSLLLTQDDESATLSFSTQFTITEGSDPYPNATLTF